MVFVIGLYAVPAAAAEARATMAEPIAVAVEPKDDAGAPEAARAAVPAAESKAISQPAPATTKPDSKELPPLEGDEHGLALEIKPFGWRIPLFGR